MLLFPANCLTLPGRQRPFLTKLKSNLYSMEDVRLCQDLWGVSLSRAISRGQDGLNADKSVQALKLLNHASLKNK